MNKEVAPVSAIIPCFRCAKTIDRAVASIVQQTQKPAEVILIDDASGDDTLVVLQTLAKQYDGWIKIIALSENQGVAHARNIGWAAATQAYIAFLDADDAWQAQKIEIQTTYMLENPSVGLCAHEHYVLEPHVSLPKNINTIITANVIQKHSLLLSNLFTPSSVMLKTDLPTRFLDKRRYMEDHFLWLDILFNGIPIVKLNARLAAQYKMAYGVSGLSANLLAMEQGELNNYKCLYNKQYINKLEWFVLSMYSLLKFVRRLMIYWGWLRWKT